MKRVNAEGASNLNSISVEERAQLADLERTIDSGLLSFFEVGTALLKIREGKLFRISHKTFESYVADRFGIGRAHANRMMASVGVVKNLSPNGDILRCANEFCLRPLTRLAPEQQREVWERAVEAAENGRPTEKLVTRVLAEVVPRQTIARRAPDHKDHSDKSLECEVFGCSDAKIVEPVTSANCAMVAPAPLGTNEKNDEDDFRLADGTAVPFAEWIPGLLPPDRIRNQLKGIESGWQVFRKSEELVGVVHAQKLVISFAAQINRLTPVPLTKDLTSDLPREVETACRVVKDIVINSLDEASTRLCNVIKTLPSESPSKALFPEKDDEEAAA
jgi:hypothetical protein